VDKACFGLRNKQACVSALLSRQPLTQEHQQQVKTANLWLTSAPKIRPSSCEASMEPAGWAHLHNALVPNRFLLHDTLVLGEYSLAARDSWQACRQAHDSYL
jgi:hypothetical protein